MSLKNIATSASNGGKSPLKLIALCTTGLLVILVASLFQGGDDEKKAQVATSQSRRGVTEWSQEPPSTAIPAATATPRSGLDSLRVGAMLVGVLALIAGGAFVLRGALKKARLVPGGNRKHLRLLDALPIGPKRFVYLVSMEDHVLVIGAGGERVELLAEYERDEVIPQGVDESAPIAAPTPEAAVATPKPAAPRPEAPAAAPEPAPRTAAPAAAARAEAPRPAAAPRAEAPRPQATTAASRPQPMSPPTHDERELRFARATLQDPPPAAAPRSAAPLPEDLIEVSAADLQPDDELSPLDFPTGMLTMPPPVSRPLDEAPRKAQPASRMKLQSEVPVVPPQALKAYQTPLAPKQAEVEIEGSHRVPPEFRHLLKRALNDDEV